MVHDCGDLLENEHWTHIPSVQKTLEASWRSIPNNLAVNGTRDTVLELQIHFWDSVFGKDRGIRDIT